jgi:hypothetical protein
MDSRTPDICMFSGCVQHVRSFFQFSDKVFWIADLRERSIRWVGTKKRQNVAAPIEDAEMFRSWVVSNYIPILSIPFSYNGWSWTKERISHQFVHAFVRWHNRHCLVMVRPVTFARSWLESLRMCQGHPLYRRLRLAFSRAHSLSLASISAFGTFMSFDASLWNLSCGANLSSEFGRDGNSFSFATA